MFLIVPILFLLISLKGVFKSFSFFKRNGLSEINYSFPFFIQILFLFWISNTYLGYLKYEPFFYVQKIRWAQQFPLIPGLGNVFSYYGLDSGHYLQLALLDSIPLISRSFWNYSGYLLALSFLFLFITVSICTPGRAQIFLHLFSGPFLQLKCSECFLKARKTLAPF